MLLATGLIAAQLTVIWALWVRRHTWRSRWDVSATLCIVFQGVALFLLSPWSDFIDVWLHRWVGLWNVEDFTAHGFFLAAAATVVHYALIRLAPDHVQQLYCDRALVFPYLVGMALMLGTFGNSNLSQHHWADLLVVYPDVWGQAYWLILSLTLAWLLGYGIYLMWRLREDPRSRRQANVYITGSVVGLLAVIARGITAIFPEWNPEGLVTWPCCDIGVMVFAIGFARSWRARQRQLLPLPTPNHPSPTQT